MTEEEVYLPSSGNIPGLPGNHGPGWYLIDYENRTIRPKPIEVVDALPAEETPPVGHSDDTTEGLQQGGVISEGTIAIAGESVPENLDVPEGATVNQSTPSE